MLTFRHWSKVNHKHSATHEPWWSKIESNNSIHFGLDYIATIKKKHPREKEKE